MKKPYVIAHVLSSIDGRNYLVEGLPVSDNGASGMPVEFFIASVCGIGPEVEDGIRLLTMPRSAASLR